MSSFRCWGVRRRPATRCRDTSPDPGRRPGPVTLVPAGTRTTAD